MSRTLLAAAAAALTLASTPARAQFEGRLDYLMKGIASAEMGGAPGGKKQEGKVTLWVSNAGTRSEMTGTMPDGKGGGRPIQIVTIWKASDPKRAIMLNDAQKTYTVLDHGDGERRERPKRKVERLGASKVAGYACERVRILGGEEGEKGQELCVTSALGKVSALARMAAEEDDLFDELRRAGLDGIPVSVRSLDEDGMSMELTAARKQAVPASLLAVPAGYKEVGMAGLLASPEQQRAIEEEMKKAMKSMTPEQKKQMEELMKQYGGGKK